MNQIIKEIEQANSIGIAGHVHPDADCVGSCTALYHYLKLNYKDSKIIDVYLETIPPKFDIWEDTKRLKSNNENGTKYDLFISLDSGSLDRLGFATEYFNAAAKTINIDHHISNTKFADINHVMDASSTCEVLFELFDESKIDLITAEALYLGIIHDTGVFKHSNTTENTMKVAGKLITKGVPFSKMIDETFYQKNYIQNQIMGRCLMESFLMLDGKCIISSVSKSTLDFYHASSADLDGIIDQLRITQGVEVAIFLYETNSHEYKVSMRSNETVDVSKVAVYFGGGGHIRAAGCTIQGVVEDVIHNLIPHIAQQLND